MAEGSFLWSTPFIYRESAARSSFLCLLTLFQNLSENLIHGANIPEQPRGLSLHRLRFQQHIPPGSQAAQGARPHPLTSHIPRPPSALSGTVLERGWITSQEEAGDVGAQAGMDSALPCRQNHQQQNTKWCFSHTE